MPRSASAFSTSTGTGSTGTGSTGTGTGTGTPTPTPFPFVYFFGINNTINGYRVDPATGHTTLVPGSPFAIGSVGIPTQGIMLDASNHHVLVQNEPTSDHGYGNSPWDLSVFNIDQGTGALMAAPGSPFPDSGSATLDPYTNNLYIQTGFQYQIGKLDDASGVATFGRTFYYLPGSEELYQAFNNKQYVFAIDPLSSSGNNSYTLKKDSTTGQLIPFSSSGVRYPYLVLGLIMDPQGRFIFEAANLTPPGQAANAAVYTILSFLVRSDGTLQQSSLPSLGYEPVSLTTDHQGRFLYVVSQVGVSGLPGSYNQLWGYRINQQDGTLTLIDGTPFTIEGGPVIDSSDQYMYLGYVPNGTSLQGFRIDQTTGALTLVQ